jgi:glyceraldehyde 3-phosphate dehydrogenase
MEKPVKIAINGLGRIGRTIVRQVLAAPECFEIVHLNDIAAPELCAYLLKFDSVFGVMPEEVTASDGHLVIGGRAIPITRSAELDGVNLSDVDVFLECTGKAKSRDIAERGLACGARSVLISGPSPAADVTVVLGANDAVLGDARIVSNASCTTNALAPLLRLVDESWGLERGHMTTIHCYTGSQPTIDAPRDDFARSRAAGLSMVPTTTSAEGQLDLVVPDLADRVSGAAVRVPTASVSAVDLVAQVRTIPQGDPVEAVRGLIAGSKVIGATDYPNVSADLRGRPESLIVALPETRVIGPSQVRIFGWSDNEWGFSARMLDMARRMASRSA